MPYRPVCSRCKATALVLCLALLQALLIPASACHDDPGDVTDPIEDNNGAECLIGGSATVSGCPITTQTPTLHIPDGVSGYVVIADGTSAGSGSVWSSAEQVSGGDTFEVPPDAGLEPLHSYQWTVSSDVGGSDAQFVWQGFTVDFIRSGMQTQDAFGPFQVNLASKTLQLTVSTFPVQSASGQFQFGFSYRSPFDGTTNGAPYFIEDPTDTLPQGWSITGLGTKVPWTRIEQIDALGGETEAVLLLAYDGSAIEYTNTGDDETGWTPPLGVGKPARTYGALSKSSDGTTFTWTSGTRVVVFTRSSSDAPVWLASESYAVLPGSSTIAPGLELTWDDEGRLSTVSDQYTVNASGVAQRVARFYYGGSSNCGTPSGDDLNGNALEQAPTGKLCAFENLDGSFTQIYYTKVSGVTDPQIGQIVLPGETYWTYGWQPTTYSVGDLSITVGQLQSVQSPTGHDAVAAGVVSDHTEASWFVAYAESDPFSSSTLQGLVSPIPGRGAQAQNRVGRYYDLDCSDDAPTACVHLADTPVVDNQQATVSKGAIVSEVVHDAAWRPLTTTTYVDGTTTSVLSATWDPELDLPLTITSAGATQTRVYDFLGRTSVLCGPDASTGQAVASCTARTANANVLTRSYNTGGLAGWVATAYENQTLSGQPANAESLNTASISFDEPPVEDASNGWSMLVRSYVEAPADGDKLRYRVVGDSNGSATLWVNGSCQDSESTDPGTSGCTDNNTVSADPNIREGNAIQLVVQYTTPSSGSVSIGVEQSIDGGSFASLDVSANRGVIA